MWDALFWLYLVNASLLLCHEIDSAYWKEWDLFGLPGGPGGFIVIHLPLAFVILWGVTRFSTQSTMALVLSFFLALGGLIAFVLHGFFMLKGNKEFRTPVSIAILLATLGVSIAQAYVGIKIIAG